MSKYQQVCNTHTHTHTSTTQYSCRGTTKRGRECLKISTKVQRYMYFLMGIGLEPVWKVEGRVRGRKELALPALRTAWQRIKPASVGLLESYSMDCFSRIPHGKQQGRCPAGSPSGPFVKVSYGVHLHHRPVREDTSSWNLQNFVTQLGTLDNKDSDSHFKII